MSNRDEGGDGFRRSELCLTTPYEPPATDAETCLAEIWQRVLNVNVIGTQDDFFEIGGDSIAAAALAGEIEACFGCNFSPSHMIDHSTIADQAVFLNGHKSASDSSISSVPSYLTLFNTDGKKKPLFIVHGNRGFTIYNKRFLDGFDPDQPIGFLEAPGLDGKEPPMEDIKQYAACYLDTIRQVAPDGNWQIVSNCAGSLIGLEICLLAEKSGENVSRLIMIDPINGRRAAWKPWRREYWGAQKKSGMAGLWSKVVRHLPIGRFRPGNGGETPYTASVEAFNQRRRHYEKRINYRLKGNDSQLVPSRVAYSADAMQNVCHALDKAFWKYVLTKRWGGQAFILICRSRLNGLGIWKSHLPNLMYRIVDHNHQSLFGPGLPEILTFLHDALSINPTEHFRS